MDLCWQSNVSAFQHKTSKRAYVETRLPGLLLSVPCPCGRPLLTHVSAGDPQTITGRSGLVFCGGHCSLPLGPDMHKILFVPPRVSVSSSPMEVLLWNPANLQSQIPWGFPVSWPDLQAGSLMWGLEPSQQCENFFGIIVLQSVSCPPGGLRIWFYCNCSPHTISLWLLCHWMWVFFFWWVPLSSWLDSTPGCDFGVLAEDEAACFYSAILISSLPCCLE